MLVRLLYASRAAGALDDALVGAILEQSRSHNLQHGITGILCTYQEGGVFLQAIEGSREAVSRLYKNIVRDDRHRDVTLLAFDEIVQRRFSGWRMGSVDMNKVNLSTILQYSEKPVLDPFAMTGEAAFALLEELATSAAIVSRDGR